LTHTVHERFLSHTAYSVIINFGSILLCFVFIACVSLFYLLSFAYNCFFITDCVCLLHVFNVVEHTANLIKQKIRMSNYAYLSRESAVKFLLFKLRVGGVNVCDVCRSCRR